ncbi:MAG: cobalamin-dependent protein [Acidobacteria bacterium]|nr:cobalamin-dependent protein [Acidobacteriota bacterium]
MRTELDTRERRDAAETLRRARESVAAAVTDEFLTRHPDWVGRYGDRARRHGLEDARFHLAFLASAMEAGSTASFEAYARWTSRMLSSRGIASAFLAENLEQIGVALGEHLEEPSAAFGRELIAAAIAAAVSEEAGGDEVPGASRLDLSRQMFTQAALAGNRKAALTVVREALRTGSTITDVYVDVLQPSQYEVGRLWERNEITVATEHVATAVTQSVLAQLYPELGTSTVRRGPAIVTGIEGELHQVGGHMLADVLEADGWDVRFLGTNLPADGVLRLAKDTAPRIVCISATMLFNLPAVVSLIEALRTQGPRPAPRIVVGGGLFRHAPDLWKEIGADGFGADLRAGIEVMREVSQEAN